MADKGSELNEIKRSGGKPQHNSGRGKYQKGDAKLGPFCFDVKEYAKSFGLSKSVWAKVSSDAVRSGSMEPAIKVILGDAETGRLRLWVISDIMFEEMIEAWSEKYE